MKVFLKICAIFVITSTVKAKYLADKPDFLTPCHLQDPNFNKCFATNFQLIIREWKDGIPGLKEIGSFDPLLIKRVVIAQDPNNPLALNAELTDVVVKGGSKMLVKEAGFNPKTLVTKIKFFVPKLRFDSNYKIDGRILNLPLRGNGKGVIEVENIDLRLNMKFKLRNENGYIFTDVDKLQVDITDIGGFHIHLANLFNGQKDLEESTNAVLNQSWRDFYEVLRPTIIEANQVVMKDRLSRAYGYVPANYFIADIASVA